MEFLEFGPFRLTVSPRGLYLHQAGKPDEFVAVTPKALETLYVLVEKNGQVVSKEDLLQRVWPDAFVEEGSIANNISMLRKILNPHFEGDGPIATVARRGYRFTAPVVLKSKKAPEPIVSDSGPLDAEAKKRISEHDAVRRGGSSEPGRGGSLDPPARRPSWLIAASLVIIVAVVGYIALRASKHEPPPPTVRRSVAVLPMKNLSEDDSQAWLSTALAETISAELAGGNHFRVVSGENVVRMQQELAPPIGVGLTRKQLDDIGSDLACDLILSGNYVVVGGKLRVDVRLDEVATGESIASASITDAQDKFLDIVSKAGSDLRSKLGLDQPSGDAAGAMRAAFTASPDALRSYFEGLEALHLRDGPRARDLLSEAIKTDPNFALAHAALSSAWRLLGYDTRGAESAKRALDLAQHLSSEDRLGVEAQYNEATAAWPKAIELYQQLWRQYPDNVEYGLKLGNAQWLGSKYADALTTVGELRKLPERDSRDTRIDLLEASVADSLSDFSRATAAAAKAAEKAEAGKAKLLLARARVKQGIYATRVAKNDEAVRDFADAEALFKELGDVGGVADALRWQATTAFTAGRYAEAGAMYDRAYQMVAPLGYVRLAVEIQLGQADNERLSGNRDKSLAFAAAAEKSARESNYRSGEARAILVRGQALRINGDLKGARDAYQQAAAMLGEIGETRFQNTAINNGAVIDFLTGDLQGARAKYETLLAYDRRVGAKAGIALRLNNLSRTLVLQGQLADAEKLNVEECALQESLKVPANLAWCRTRLAEIYLARGRKSEAEELSKKISLPDFGSNVSAPIYIAHYARLQVGLGHVDAAATAIALAEKVQAAAGPVEEQAIHVATIRAEVEAAQGKKAAAIARLNKARADADRLGLGTWSLDAQRVLARIQS